MNIIERVKKLWEIYILKAPQISKRHEENNRCKGEVLTHIETFNQKKYKACSHRKGGVAANLSVRGISEALNNGTGEQYAVIKHRLMNCDWWVRCLRCGKTWTKPVRSNYKTNFDYEMAEVQYGQAVNFPTNNAPSSSIHVIGTHPNSDFNVRFRKLVTP